MSLLWSSCLYPHSHKSPLLLSYQVRSLWYKLCKAMPVCICSDFPLVLAWGVGPHSFYKFSRVAAGFPTVPPFKLLLFLFFFVLFIPFLLVIRGRRFRHSSFSSFVVVSNAFKAFTVSYVCIDIRMYRLYVSTCKSC